MSIFAKQRTESETEELLRTSAQLAAQGRCPVCAGKLETKPCPDCAGQMAYSFGYCPTCQNTGIIQTCPNAPHPGA